MDDIFLKEYRGIPLWMFLEQSQSVGKVLQKVRDGLGLQEPMPDITNKVMLDLVVVDDGTPDEPAFLVEVWAHNLKDPFTSFQFDFDGREGDHLVLPEGVDFDGVTKGPALDHTWYVGSQRLDGHPKEGLVGAGTGVPFKPDGTPILLCTGHFNGPVAAASDLVLRRAGISFYGMKHDVLETENVFPGA